MQMAATILDDILDLFYVGNTASTHVARIIAFIYVSIVITYHYIVR